MTVIERAIESAKNRKYKLEEDLSHNISDLHRKKANGQKEVMQVTIEALEKQIPKKPTVRKTPNTSFGKARTYYKCPNCGSNMCWDWNCCPHCGQALKWGEEDD